MPYNTIQVMPFGFKSNRRRIQRKSFSVTDYENFSFFEDDFRIAFYTRSGVLLGYLFTGIKETIIINMTFVNDLRGCASGTIELSTLPTFPIPTYCQVLISYQGSNIYNGYAWKPTTQETTKNESYKIQFFGLRKKYETTPINLEYYPIQSITVSSPNVTYNFSGVDLTGLLVGQKIAARNCQDGVNNGYYSIASIGVNSVTVNNAAGIAQATILGSAAFLPWEWSTNVLVSEAFSQICQAYGGGLGIEFSPLLVEESTGLTVGGMRDHEGMTIQKALELLEKLARGRYAMGVNADGFYFFKAIESEPIKKFILGYDVNKQAVNTNYDNIKNVINVNRAKGKGETGGGWITAASSFDNTSVAKWGSSTKNITVPEFVDDSTAQTIADSELEYLKDPKQYAKVENLKFDGLLEIGNYGVVSPFGDYTTVIDEMDSISGWITIDSSAFTESNILISGARSIRYAVDAIGIGSTGSAYKSYTIDTRNKKALKFWVQTNKSVNIQVLLNGYLALVDVDILNDWTLVEIDISNYADYPFIKLTQIYFTFTTTGAGAFNHNIYIDEITLVSYDAIHTDLPYKQATYDLKAHERTVTLELGLQQDSLSEYLANLQNTIETNNLLLKDRSTS